MDNKTQNILQKFSTQKVDLSSSLKDILKKLEVFNNVLDQEERKLDKPYQQWETTYLNWIDTLKDTEQDVDEQEAKLKIFKKKASELGIDANNIKGLDKAQNMIKTLKFYIKKSKAVNWNI